MPRKFNTPDEIDMAVQKLENEVKTLSTKLTAATKKLLEIKKVEEDEFETWFFGTEKPKESKQTEETNQ